MKKVHSLSFMKHFYSQAIECCTDHSGPLFGVIMMINYCHHVGLYNKLIQLLGIVAKCLNITCYYNMSRQQKQETY